MASEPKLGLHGLPAGDGKWRPAVSLDSLIIWQSRTTEGMRDFAEERARHTLAMALADLLSTRDEGQESEGSKSDG